MKKTHTGDEPIGSDLITFIYYTFFTWNKEIKKCITTHTITQTILTNKV